MDKRDECHLKVVVIGIKKNCERVQKASNVF
jgi:hypothetical protein